MLAAVDTYLLEGCGRCSLYRTPECKVHRWPNELKALRQLVLDCGLEETYKWSQPCYTYSNANVLLVTAFNDYACISFFKGSLLADEKGILTTPGENSQAGRQLRFTDVQQITDLESTIKAYVFEAIEIEKAGLKVQFKKTIDPYPEELTALFQDDDLFKSAFERLSPGRQRGYLLFFTGAKQSKTRLARIEKYRSQIMNGEGIHDAYKKKK